MNWTTQDGRRIPIPTLETSHLLNVLIHIETRMTYHGKHHYDLQGEEILHAVYSEALKRGLVSMPWEDYCSLEEFPARTTIKNYQKLFDSL